MLNFFMGLLRKRGEKNIVIFCSGVALAPTAPPSSYASDSSTALSGPCGPVYGALQHSEVHLASETFRNQEITAKLRTVVTLKSW